MKALIQRVRGARVTVDGQVVGEINTGILVLLGVDKGDDRHQIAKLGDKILRYRIFPDSEGRMNQSLLDIDGELLIVSQFTLSATTTKGLRPSFASAAQPTQAEDLYELLVDHCKKQLRIVETGSFGADMQVSLTNDGPVTFMLEA